MAGILSSYRTLLVFNTFRLTDKKGILLDFTRKRHHLVFRVSSLQNKVAHQKPKFVNNANRLLLYRLASTNVDGLKESVSVPNVKVSEIKNDTSQLNREPVESSKAHDVLESSNSNFIDESLLPPIPSEVPEVPAVDLVSLGLKEPTFESLGLGSWWPSGIFQQLLEFLHINMNLPWWEAILIVVLVFRSLILPINVSCKRELMTLTSKHMPVIQNYNRQINDARLRGDHFNCALHFQELQKYIADNKVNFFSSFKVPLVQAPVFISMYYALSGMANAPVESLKTGGLYWFEDLTQPDPYYILPVILAGSLLAVIETGAEGTPVHAQSHMMKWIFRGIPAVVFIISLKFAACLTWYWTISNFISLICVLLFKVPVIKKFLRLPDMNPESLAALRKNQKGFLEGFKEGIENAKLTSEIQNREKMNLMEFQKAGTGPVLRTFKKNPLLENAKKSS